MPSSHQSGLESGRVTGRPASPPPLTPESLLAAMPIGDLLQNLVATQPARQKQSWTARPVSAGAAVETAVSGSGPGIHNTFNVTVHSAGGPGDGPDNETEIADRITRILVDQARRHGIDIT